MNDPLPLPAEMPAPETAAATPLAQATQATEVAPEAPDAAVLASPTPAPSTDVGDATGDAAGDAAAVMPPPAPDLGHGIDAPPATVPPRPVMPAIPELSPAACAARLAELFPAQFAPGAAKPLKLRIQADIQQRAPGIFTKRTLSVFLHRHTTSTPYLKAMVNATNRFDLDGQPAGELADEHRVAATAELARRRAMQDARRQAERDAQRAAQREAYRAQRGASGQTPAVAADPSGEQSTVPTADAQPVSAPAVSGQSASPDNPTGAQPRPPNVQRPPRPDRRGPRPDPRGPRTDGPRADAAGPRPDATGPRPDMRGPRADVRGPGPDTRPPRPEGRAPRPDRPRHDAPGQRLDPAAHAQTDAPQPAADMRSPRPPRPESRPPRAEPRHAVHPAPGQAGGFASQRPAQPTAPHVSAASSPTSSAEDEARRTRAAVARAFEASPLKKANFCVLKGLTEAQLDAVLAQVRSESPAPAPRPPQAERSVAARPGQGERGDRERSRGGPRHDGPGRPR